MRRLVLLLAVLGSFLAIVAATGSGSGSFKDGASEARPATAHQPSVETAAQSYGKLPLAFEPNRGQADAAAAFLARGAGYSIALRASEALFMLGKRDTLRMKVAGASEHVPLVAEQRLPGKVNYLLGNDRSRWFTGLPTYARVTAKDVYPGIDLTYYGLQGKLEYDFVLEPGTDPKRIALGFEGARRIRLDRSGTLVIELETGTVRQLPPRIYQRIDGVRHAVEGGFSLHGGQVRFALGPYDRSRELVIDPQLVYSTYLGGSAFERAYGIAVDGSGAAYITGYTDSSDFPTAGPYQGNVGSTDAFVTKLTPAGNSFAYSTYLGGSSVEEGLGIAVDSAGAAYVTGHTSSTDFPTANAFQPANGSPGNYDTFVTKLDPSGGNLAYSTYLGGNGWDVFTQIAVDGAGSAYIAGRTESPNFPTLNAYQPALNPGFGSDVFLTKLAANGSALVYSTFLGGSAVDQAHGIAVDGAGAAYISGSTRSLDFPTANPYQAAKAGNASQYDAFVTKFNASGSALVYSTYLGGATSDGDPSISVGGAGSAYISGDTTSPNFPTVNAHQATHGGGIDGYVTKFTPGGNALVYSTYLGGSGFDVPNGVAVDAAGSVYLGGYTDSPNYPTAGPCPRTSSGVQDAFVTKLNPSGIGLAYSTYVGGSSGEFTFGFAIDGAGAAYVTGSTNSTNFPVVNPVQPALAGAGDVFVSKVGDSPATTACLRALEVNQSIQTWRNTIELVKDKDTGVRAFVQTAVAGAPNQNVVGRLHGDRAGVPLPGSPLTAVNPGGSVLVQPDIVSRRGALADSLNFNLPASWRTGTIRLRFETPGTPLECQEPVSPLAAPFSQDAMGDCSVVVTFVPRTRPKVVVVSVPYVDGATQTPTTAELIEQMLRTISIFPTDTIRFELDSIAALPSKPEPKVVNPLLMTKRAVDTSATCPSSCRTTDFRYYGVMVGNPPDGATGLATGPVSSGYLEGVGARTAGGFGRTTAAHELGHVYGRPHAVDNTMPLTPEGWKQGQCSEVAAATAPQHTPFELVGGNRRPVLGPLSLGPDFEVWGLDTRFLAEPAVNLAVIDPRQVFELMSYCNGGQPPENWISKYTYEALYGAFPTVLTDRSSDSVGSTTVTGDFVLVGGSINVDLLAEQATLQPATVASGTFDVPVAGAYRVRLLDVNDVEVAGASFEPNEGGEPSPKFFLVPVPRPTEPVARIQILHNGAEIGSAPASATAPTASIVTPSSGQSFSGPTATFDWTASDLDGDALSSNVLYSPDGGISWNALAIDHAATELTVPRSALTASTDARLRVVVSDGVNTASVDSDQFSVANNAPDVEITSPPSGQQFTLEQTITLQGLALDREDGSLDGSIAWSSDGDALGSGSSISVLGSYLGAGTHVITATSTDGAGASGTETITIEVAGPTRVTLRSFSAKRSQPGVALRWRTGSEVSVAGFNVYRGMVRVNRTLVRAKGGTKGATYRFFDRSAPRYSATYRLQAVLLDGTRAWTGRARVSRR